VVTETGKLLEKRFKEMDRADFTTCPLAIQSSAVLTKNLIEVSVFTIRITFTNVVISVIFQLYRCLNYEYCPDYVGFDFVLP
jgi:hypothetical protein